MIQVIECPRFGKKRAIDPQTNPHYDRDGNQYCSQACLIEKRANWKKRDGLWQHVAEIRERKTDAEKGERQGKMKIIAIDPGTTKSAYVIMDGYQPIDCGKVGNDELARLLRLSAGKLSKMVIECMESRRVLSGDGGIGVIGKETYETAEWIGRFKQIAEDRGLSVHSIYRSQELKTIIPTKKNKLPPLPEGAPKAHDGKIRMALCMRFAPNDLEHYGKGTKENPGWFRGFHDDIWQAYAVGVTWMDTIKGAKKK